MVILRKKTLAFVAAGAVVGCFGIFYSRTKQIFKHKKRFFYIYVKTFSFQFNDLLSFHKHAGISMNFHNLRGGPAALEFNECGGPTVFCPTLCVDGASCLITKLPCPEGSFCFDGKTEAFECPFEGNHFNFQTITIF